MAKVKSFLWLGLRVYIAWTVISLVFELLNNFGGDKLVNALQAFRSAPLATLKNLNSIFSQS